MGAEKGIALVELIFLSLFFPLLPTHSFESFHSFFRTAQSPDQQNIFSCFLHSCFSLRRVVLFFIFPFLVLRASPPGVSIFQNLVRSRATSSHIAPVPQPCTPSC